MKKDECQWPRNVFPDFVLFGHEARCCGCKQHVNNRPARLVLLLELQLPSSLTLLSVCYTKLQVHPSVYISLNTTCLAVEKVEKVLESM